MNKCISLSAVMMVGLGLLLLQAGGCDNSGGNENSAQADAQKVSASASGSGQIVNTHCPIMGSKIDPKSVPASLTRQYKNQTVGFCCAGCPGAWDKLSDSEKDAKLSSAGK